ncbi:hypothetical protein MVES1_002372 [Malassezia vespertilionis]|uniref:Rab-GAP TBC domain-containing protein n=1 Tax=Malassezia vespertilionis TaxID=2020962 RepID=A0A2N1JBE8_9BASI|nr:uncharacterized protein MVES1_002372 [Malassezia vespertilionis]PKI83880.1 hypothetical protein MVES_002238 [Malassezia vespertilionis]WFD07016.1 hypothetical protein MVES1_002372 [Malassezia vespertilionis]
MAAYFTVRWRVYLGDWQRDNPSLWVPQAEAQRRAYRHLLQKFLATLHVDHVHGADPLQNGAKNVWQKRAAAQQNMDQITLDVQRMQLGTDMQEALTRILFVWSCMHKDLGYKQGMHEIAEWLWRLRARESIMDNTAHGVQDKGTSAEACESAASLSAAQFATLLSQDAVEDDTYFLVSSVLERLLPQFNAERAGSPALLKALLHRVDPLLAKHLAEIHVDWQPVLLRWHRLLYLNTFPADEILMLWDALFAIDPALQLMQYVSAAMIVRQRDQLLVDGPTDAMHHLLHYGDQEPRPSAALLVEQALKLQLHPSLDTVEEIVRENKAMVGAQHAHNAPPPECAEPHAPLRLAELTKIKAQQFATDIMRRAPFFRPTLGTEPAWGPLAEDRLHTEPCNIDTQRRQAMLSFDDVKHSYMQ